MSNITKQTGKIESTQTLLHFPSMHYVLSLQPKEQKRGALEDLNFLRGVAGKVGVDFFRGVAVFTLNKLKSEIFNDRKVYEQKRFSVITKNLNREILTKNLVTFKRWDGVKDEKF